MKPVDSLATRAAFGSFRDDIQICIITLGGANMSIRIPVPRWVVCVAFGMCTGFAYFVVKLLLSHREWYHKIGEGPAVSQWIDALDMVLGDLPFGYLVRDGNLSYLLNALLWSALGSGLCAFHFWNAQRASNKPLHATAAAPGT